MELKWCNRKLRSMSGSIQKWKARELTWSGGKQQGSLMHLAAWSLRRTESIDTSWTEESWTLDTDACACCRLIGKISQVYDFMYHHSSCTWIEETKETATQRTTRYSKHDSWGDTSSAEQHWRSENQSNKWPLPRALDQRQLYQGLSKQEVMCLGER
jgi:hypothetical protein